MRAIIGQDVKLLDTELRRRENENRNYMLRLTNENLMRNYMLEAGLWSSAELKTDIHGGWESPTCALRGHFTGHYLSASAMMFHAHSDMEIKGKADMMIEDLERCQKEHGNGWAGSIPEKYLHWIARGKEVWAPHYTVHKTLMGLVDMAVLTKNEKALAIADRWGKWFDEWTTQFTREQMDDILDVETGGMLEIWAEMLSLTGKERYKRLLERYDRARLFDELLKGNDPLTNMHANTTIPEVLGCARAWEVTGEPRYRKIVEAYWKCAVEDRPAYATGGQTCGEVWTPKDGVSSRLGRKAQEHCTVYNMMRLADFLFRWTKDVKYADYIEKNLYNGIMAQSYYRNRDSHGHVSEHPSTGLLTYFLPMRGGDHKGWASETDAFYCCHGTLIQANAAHNRYLYYQDEKDVYICQFFDSNATLSINDKKVIIRQRIDHQTGSFHLASDSSKKQAIGEITSKVIHNPEMLRVVLEIVTDEPIEMNLHIRIPAWAGQGASHFFTPEQTVWRTGDQLTIDLKQSISVESLPGDESRIAFLYGPIVLAGLTDSECTLHPKQGDPITILARANEREWGSWMKEFITVTEERAIRFIPLYDVGYENYSVYFRI